MFALRRLPACVALLLLGALSLRLGLRLPVAALLTLALVVLLFTPRPTAQRLAARLVWLGVPAWAGVAWLRASERLALDLPWLRLVGIFSAVAGFTAWAAWLLRARAETPDRAKPGRD